MTVSPAALTAVLLVAGLLAYAYLHRRVPATLQRRRAVLLLATTICGFQGLSSDAPAAVIAWIAAALAVGLGHRRIAAEQLRREREQVLPSREDAMLDEFRSFLDGVDPGDFAWPHAPEHRRRGHAT